MLSAEQLHHFKKLLTQSLNENEQQIEQNHHFGLHEEQNNVGFSGELSNYDNHPADSATELYEREKDLAIDDHYRDEVDEIRTALTAIEKGTYGVCQVCQKEIPVSRLEALPTATTCIEHSQQQNLNEYRPIEEEVINADVEVPHDDNNGFDEEDSWQSVAKWGIQMDRQIYTMPQQIMKKCILIPVKMLAIQKSSRIVWERISMAKTFKFLTLNSYVLMKKHLMKKAL